MPVDSDFFDGINPAQWSWYQVQHWLDEKDKYELLRDVAEHNAMFSNPDGVRQIRDARENKFEMPEEDFTDFVTDMFGRGLDENDRPFTHGDVAKNNLKPYFDLELDEINFTPYED